MPKACCIKRLIYQVRLILLMPKVEVGITKMSSKGQVVIPVEMRQGIHEGEKLLIVRQRGCIVLKKAGDLAKDLVEDLEFAKRTEDAWREYDKGKFITMPADKFLKKLAKC